MGEIASRSQLQMAFLRKAIVTVPLVVLLGVISGQLSDSTATNGWFLILAKPALMPPAWVFGFAWTLLYILQGLALAAVLNARGNRAREVAIALFAVQLAINLAWPPVFFALHEVGVALILLILLLTAAFATTVAFGVVRASAAWLMVPYLAWLCYATALTNDIRRLNPNAENLVPRAAKAQITL